MRSPSHHKYEGDISLEKMLVEVKCMEYIRNLPADGQAELKNQRKIPGNGCQTLKGLKKVPVREPGWFSMKLK